MKFKKIPINYLLLCFDRLTRFKPSVEKYPRVFLDIINKFAIKETGDCIDLTNIDCVIEISTNIINFSVGNKFENDFYINNLIKKNEFECFFQDKESEKYLNNKINYKNVFDTLRGEKNIPKNLLWLMELEKNRCLTPFDLRKKSALKFPIRKVVLAEGATEEILLPILGENCGWNFYEEGIYIIPAGGKSQVGKKYLQMIEQIKLPIFILMDFDAYEIKNGIEARLRDIDEIYLIKNGEFEDVLPKKLIINALNFHFMNGHKCFENEFQTDLKMAKNLEEIFKLKGFGDFKKSEFANYIKNFLQANKTTFEPCEICTIIEKIAKPH